MSQRFRDYLSVVFIAPLMIFLSAAITTSANTSFVMEYIEKLPAGSSFVAFSSDLIPYLIMSMGFAFIYLFLPNTQVRFLPAFVGGLVTAIIWKVMGWGVSTFIANSASNIAIYSAFASVIILMVWMYIGWLVLLVGASVSFYFQNPQYILVRRDSMQLNGENAESLALSLMYLIGLHYHKSMPAWDVDRLGQRLRVPPHLVEDMLDFLVSQSYVVRTGEGCEEIYPAQPMEQLLVRDLLRCVRELSLNGERPRDIRGELPVASVLDEMRAAIEQRFGDKTLKDLIDQH